MNERDYQESCKKAEFLGYKPIPDPKAYREIAHINDDKKIWIHDIIALAIKLKAKTEEELILFNYNVEDYYKYRKLTFEQTTVLACQEEMLEMFGDCPFDESGMTYLSDGMYMTESGNIIDMKGR